MKVTVNRPLPVEQPPVTIEMSMEEATLLKCLVGRLVFNKENIPVVGQCTFPMEHQEACKSGNHIIATFFSQLTWAGVK